MGCTLIHWMSLVTFRSEVHEESNRCVILMMPCVSQLKSHSQNLVLDHGKMNILLTDINYICLFDKQVKCSWKFGMKLFFYWSLIDIDLKDSDNSYIHLMWRVREGLLNLFKWKNNWCQLEPYQMYCLSLPIMFIILPRQEINNVWISIFYWQWPFICISEYLRLSIFKI